MYLYSFFVRFASFKVSRYVGQVDGNKTKLHTPLALESWTKHLKLIKMGVTP